VGVAWEGLMPESSVSLPAQWARLAPEIALGRLVPVIGEVLPFERAMDAVAALDERRAAGKTVVVLRD